MNSPVITNRKFKLYPERGGLKEHAMELFTIGYEGLNLDSLLQYLQYYKIDMIADVRELPLSRKKGFSKNGLTEFLKMKNINYVNYRELGVSKDLRRQLKETGDYRFFFNKVRKIIYSKSEQLDQLCDLIHQGKKIALLCFERDPKKCHRKIVAEGLKKRDGNGLKIKHIKPFYLE